MSPSALYHEFLNLAVILFDGTFVLGLKVDHYFISDATGTKSGAAFTELEAAVKRYGIPDGTDRYRLHFPLRWEKDEADESSVAGGPDIGVRIVERGPQAGGPLGRPRDEVILLRGKCSLYDCFIGKGNPDKIRTTLRVAAGLGLVAGTRAALQQYLTNNIGMDCSGFAAAYFGPKTYWSIPISTLMQPAVRQLSEVRQGTALIWPNKDHIAVVDSVVSRDYLDDGRTVYALDAVVVESTSDRLTSAGVNGLQRTTYTIMVREDDQFRILRPLPGARAMIEKTVVGDVMDYHCYLANPPMAN
jgi:hypothetical protein